MKTGVIIGRFQSAYIHKGYIHLINYVLNQSDKLIFIIGTTEAIYTDRNPLSFNIIKEMIEDLSITYHFHDKIEIKQIKDHKNNETWSKRLDDILNEYENVIMYVSRDSFKPYYSGKNIIEEVPEIKDICATNVRKEIKSNIINTSDFRKGIIYTTQNRYPSIYPTVDIAVINLDKKQILLGRKEGNEKYCLIGGFVDPKDDSYEKAAWRELNEEVQGINIHPLEYVCSTKVNDWRYRGTKDGIMTTLFLAYYFHGHPVASDDLNEVKWFDINIAESIITDEHISLIKIIKQKLDEKEHYS